MLYTASGVRSTDRAPHEAHGEELGMEVAWWPLSEVVDGVLAGRLRNPSLVLGVLALMVRRQRDSGAR